MKMFLKLGSYNHDSFFDSKCGKIAPRRFISYLSRPTSASHHALCLPSSCPVGCFLCSWNRWWLTQRPGVFVRLSLSPPFPWNLWQHRNRKLSLQVPRQRWWVLGLCLFSWSPENSTLSLTSCFQKTNHVNRLVIGRLLIPAHHVIIINDCEIAVQGHRFPFLFIHYICRLMDWYFQNL